MDYAENYERCMKEKTSFIQQLMIDNLSKKAQSYGQTSHKMWLLKYIMDNYFEGKEDFWNDITHKRPITIKSLPFLFEIHAMETFELAPYNHKLFIVGNLFPKPIHKFLTNFMANSLLYIDGKTLE